MIVALTVCSRLAIINLPKLTCILMKRIFFVILILVIGGLAGYFVFNIYESDFESLSAAEMHEQIVAERDLAIGKAVVAGDYRCCIKPPCTMCYMQANKWNNYTAGTCACDNLVAKGEEACPECQRGLEQMHTEENTFCDISAVVESCDSTN